MASVRGVLRKDANHSENVVLQQLIQLPDDFLIYPEKLIGYESERGQARPDFIVLHRDLGVVIVEVKGWTAFRPEEDGSVTAFFGKKQERRGDPTVQAQGYVDRMRDDMKKVPSLTHPTDPSRAGVPCLYVLLFPFINSSPLKKMERYWGASLLIGRDDLAPARLEHRLRTLPFKFKSTLSQYQFDSLRSLVSPSDLNVIHNGSDTVQYLNEEQEVIVTENIAIQTSDKLQAQQATFLETELSAQANEIAITQGIRLVRGVAGSGKSLVLARRAEFIKMHNPDSSVLILAYNRKLVEDLRNKLTGRDGIEVCTFHEKCRHIIEPVRGWSSPERIKSWVRSKFGEWPALHSLGPDYVAAEIEWRKDTGIFERDEYLNAIRKGRGKALQLSQREHLDAVFEQYRTWQQQSYGVWDWEDVPHYALDILRDINVLDKYDAILVDEAQDFAPSWIQVVKLLLKPGGLLFLADDPGQSIFKYFSWKEKGIPVVGRTRWLCIPYRNTHEIHRAAYSLIKDDPVLVKRASAENSEVVKPDFSTHQLRHGPRPVVAGFSNQKSEYEFVQRRVLQLLNSGIQGSNIAVLHPRKWGVDNLRKILAGLSVTVTSLQSIKGLEYHTVFIVQSDELLSSLSNDLNYAQKLSEAKLLYYVGMTRAREQLLMSYQKRWPKELKSVLSQAIQETH